MPSVTGISVDGTDGYIDLTTAADFLNNLLVGKFAIIQVVQISSDCGNVKRILSVALAGGTGFHLRKHIAAEIFASLFYGTDASLLSATGITEDASHSIAAVFDIGNTNSYLLIDGALEDTDAADDLDVIQATLIRLGANAYDAGDKAVATFGFTAVLDLTNVATTDQTFAENLSLAIHGAAFSPYAIRAAIMGVDANITGVFWKLDEAGGIGAFDSQTVVRYDITDGSVDAANGGTSSAAGCDGTFISGSFITEILRPNAAGDLTECNANPGVPNWQNIDEAVADDDSTYNYVETEEGPETETDLCNLGDSGVGVGDIAFIRVHVRGKYNSPE